MLCCLYVGYLFSVEAYSYLFIYKHSLLGNHRTTGLLRCRWVRSPHSHLSQTCRVCSHPGEEQTLTHALRVSGGSLGLCQDGSGCLSPISPPSWPSCNTSLLSPAPGFRTIRGYLPPSPLIPLCSTGFEAVGRECFLAPGVVRAAFKWLVIILMCLRFICFFPCHGDATA